MIRLNKIELIDLSLSDYPVSRMTLSEGHKIITLHIDGATLFSTNKTGDIFDSCDLIIESPNEIKISLYDHEEKKWTGNTVGDVLKDICELLIDDDIFLRGFGLNTGMWMEIKILKPIDVTAILN